MLNDYQAQLERLYQCFLTCPDPQVREKNDGWCVKEILGHLFDSVSNNHQRLLRYLPGATLQFPGYDQATFVARAHYDSFEYQKLLSLWYLHNQLLLHIFAHIPVEEQGALIQIGDRPAITITQLMADYFAHMEKHYQQVMRIAHDQVNTETESK